MSGAATPAPALVLHDYWRSGAAYRVRIALNIKGVPYTQVPHDLRQGAQRATDYLALNPQGLVPTLAVDGLPLTQSGAILDYLDERFPDPPLLPRGAEQRAIVRAIAQTIACDVHPLINLRVLTHLRTTFDREEGDVQAWIATWMRQGFAALDQMVARHGGRFAFGDSLTLADCHIVPQFYAARRFAVPTDDFPALSAVAARAVEEAPVRCAHPDLQSDAG